MPTLQLKPDKSRQIFGRHPWVRASSLKGVDAALEAGATVDVADDRGRWLGRGIFNRASQIAVRLYSFLPHESLDEDFLRRRIAEALELRRVLGLDHADGGARLIFSEADGLSGLVVDRYADRLVIQVTALAMNNWLPVIVAALRAALDPRGILVRADPRMAKAEGIVPREEVVWGEIPAEGITIQEHGVAISFDLLGGQKTGLYLDQRANRLAAAQYARGRRVLDACCHVGGFGLCAAVVGGAATVDFLDGAARPLEAARRNAERNGVTAARFLEGDCFDTLARMRADGEKYQMMVLDPPRFASSRRTVPAALQAYHRLNRLAVELLEPGGILVTCSCSGNVSRQQFVDVLGGVSRKTGREILLLENRGASPDHPVRLACPETDYLKCLIAQVR